MTRLARGSHPTKKKIFNDADAELTLKLLKITPKVEELSVQRSDSEFLKDYNSTARQQSASSQVVISTEGSDENVSLEAPILEQAYKMMAPEQLNSDVAFKFGAQGESIAVLSQKQYQLGS